MSFRIEMQNEAGILDQMYCANQSETKRTLMNMIKSCEHLQHGDKFVVIDQDLVASEQVE